MSQITTHVLDTRLGKPAVGIAVALELREKNDWRQVGQGVTNGDGRILDLLGINALQVGTYRITFDTGAYFQSSGTTGFYPEVSIVFAVTDKTQHYHVPLILNPYGYSTYRGS